jgi:pyruvate-formate lyase
MSRTETYKKIAYENGDRFLWYPIEYEYLTAQSILNMEKNKNPSMNRSRIECDILDQVSIDINDLELLVGRPSNLFVMTPEKQAVLDEVAKTTDRSSGYTTNATWHRVVDYEKLLGQGLKGILSEIDGYLEPLNDQNDPDHTKREFYQSTKDSLFAVLRLAKRFRMELLAKMKEETDPIRKQELQKMADNFLRAPYEPCEHFYEALQCMLFLQFCFKCVNDYSLTGRPDQYLYPYYKKDMEDGSLTKEFAFELIEQLYFKMNELYNRWPSPVMVGGTDKKGNPVWNDLSYMCIEAIETTGLINPSVAVCYTEQMPDDFLSKCIDIISKGYTRPAIFNDKIVREGLMWAGVSEEDARYYIHSTCVEVTPIGNSNICVATPYVNLNRAFDLLFHEKNVPYVIGNVPNCSVGNGGDETENYLAHDIDISLDGLDTFEDFYREIKKIASEIIGAHVGAGLDYTDNRLHNCASPLASAFLDDCLARGIDSGKGGAKYNFVYPCFPGFVNFVDSIVAVKKAVYDDKMISLRDLAKLCCNNFEGNAKMHQYLLNVCPKFGNNIPESDQMANELYEFIKDELDQYHIAIGAKFFPSYFAFNMHGLMGEKTMATPDGRKAGEALSENLGAMQGRDKNGPIGVMRSISKLEQRHGIGGIATNFRFSKPFIRSEHGMNAVKDFVKVFMENECFEMQFNVMDKEDLVRARKHPEQYKTLMVRVAGFSDYFVNLLPVIQEEVMKRSEYGDF